MSNYLLDWDVLRESFIKELYAGENELIPATVETKLIAGFQAVVKKLEATDKFYESDPKEILSKLLNNNFIKKLDWDPDLLTKKYGHLIYTQNLRTVNTQFKKILIKDFGAVEIKVENVTRLNITKLLNDILQTADVSSEIKTLIQAYALKYKLLLKNG